MSSQTIPPSETLPFDLPRLCRYFSDRSPQPMVAVEGPTHVIRYVNKSFSRLLGMASEKLLGHSFAEIMPRQDGDECMAFLDRVYHTGKPMHLHEQEYRQDPPAYWSYEMWAILGDGDAIVGVMIQVTDSTETAVFRRQARAMNEALVVSSVRQHELLETIERNEQSRRELEAQMFQAQKLESLGVLAGGIAHDLNNLLTPVLGYTELAADTLPKGSRASQFLEEVTKNARLAANLVQQILAYAGKGHFVFQLVNLSTLVRDMSGLLTSAVSIHVKLEFDLLPSLPLIEADATQLFQVVLNLVTNASEAIGDAGGTITIRTGLAASPNSGPSTAKHDLPTPIPSVFLEVEDTGCGMGADVIEKMFDPFFTTKFTGRGLGLAVVHGIVRRHGGLLQVQSEPGKGSSFRLTLPCSAKTVVPPPVPKSAAGWRGTGTILVIDDDEMVRGLMAQVLQRAGLTVFIALDGPSGLKEFREHSSEIDAVILDLTMPRMSGLEVAEALRKLKPNLPIVLMSGFSVIETTRLAAGIEISGFVQKPFKSAELLAKVRHALGQETTD